MKNYFLISLASFCFGFAQDPASRGPDSGIRFLDGNDTLARTLLWRISGKDLRGSSYLFGTMHVLCAEDARLSDSMQMAIQQTDEIYFEINLDDIMGMVQSLKYMRMTGSKKLSDYLDSSQYQKVKTYFDKQGSILPFSMLERFKPLLISSLIEEDGLDCKSTNGMELVIQKQAHLKSKKILGLETAEFQASLFDSIPYAQQAKDLVNYIDSIDFYKKTTNELVEVYRAQDLDRIDFLTRTGDASMSNYIDLLLYGRNRKWMDSLKIILPSKSVLIAVGAGHLPGEQGLIHLLKKGRLYRRACKELENTIPIFFGFILSETFKNILIHFLLI